MDLSDSDLERIADDLGVDVTALQSDAVKDCAESVFEDNPDMSKSQAFAVCQSMENKGKLQAHVALAEQDTPGRIERVEQDDGSVRYRNLKLLGVGTWGDAATQRQFLYSAKTIQALADSITDDTLNLFHEQDNETTEIGSLDRESVYIGDDDGLYGDLVLSMDNSASEFADEALQDALESGGRQGLKGPSLEIKDPDHDYNRSAGALEVVDGTITGVALVGLGVSPGPGSKDAAFAEQTRERAVALADAEAATVLTQENNDSAMSNQIAEQLADQLDAETLHALADAHDITLQTDSEMGMVADLIDQAATEGFDPGDQSVDELRAFIDENLDPSEDAMAAFDSVAGAVVDAMDADDEDSVAAEDMADWIAEQMADGEESEDDDPEDDDSDMGDDMEMAEQVASLAERVDAIESALEGAELSNLQETVTTLSEAVDARAQQDRVESLAEDVTALQETVDDIADNLEESSSLASMGGTDTPDADAESGPRTTFGDTNAANRTY
jgi:hypothetical protein